MNNTFINQWHESTKEYTFIDFKEYNFNTIIKTDCLRLLDLTLISGEEFEKIKEFIENVEKIKNIKKAMRREEIENFVTISNDLLVCIENINKRNDVKF